MLYIISGASRSGKTKVAKELSKRYNLPYLSTDYLMMGFMNGVPEMGIHDKLWPNEIAQKMWRFLEPFMETIIYSQEDYVLEGEAFLPELLKDFIDKYPTQVKVCFMGYHSISVLEKMNYIKTYASKNDWLANLPNHEIVSHIENMIQYSKQIEEMALKNNLTYIDTSEYFINGIETCIGELIRNEIK